MGRSKGVDDALAKGEAVIFRKHTKQKSLVVPAPDWPGRYGKPQTFPVNVFPPAIRSFVRAVAESVQSGPCIPALTLLTVAGAAIGTTRRFDFRPDWGAFPLLYSAIVGESGTGKSPAMGKVLAPVYGAQNVEIDDAKGYRELYDAELDRRRQEDPNVTRLDGWRSPESVSPRRYIVSDSTMEALVKIHAENPRGMLYYRDEFASWVKSMDAYRGGKGGDRQQWLSIYDSLPIIKDRATGPDRKSNGTSIHVPRGFVAVLGSIQPSVIPELASKHGKEDGFLPRVSFAFPPDALHHAPYSRRALTHEESFVWVKTYRDLIALNPEEKGQPVSVVPGEGVEAEFGRWYDVGVSEIRLPDFPLSLRPYWSKLRNFVLRVALILHVLKVVSGEADEDPGVISRETMVDAARVADWQKSHLVAVVSEISTSEEMHDLARLVHYIERKYPAGEDGSRLVKPGKLAMAKITKELTPVGRIRTVLRVAVEQGMGEWCGNDFKLYDPDRPRAV